LDCELLEQAWARLIIADIAVIADIARDRGKTQSVEIVQLQKSLARATLTLAGMTLQAREKLQEDVEDGRFALVPALWGRKDSPRIPALAGRAIFSRYQGFYFFYKEFSGFLQTARVPNPKYLDRNSGQQNTS
jgi:hypothetical protein